MTAVKRQPKGTSAGGQFAPDVNRESTVELVDDSPAVNFGDVSHIHAGSRTPWGPAQTAYHLAPGIVSVGCSQHGGVKLSPERNRLVPRALRNDSGWYEEDCEWAIAAMTHPEAFVAQGESIETTRDHAEKTVIDWFPEKYEAATGKELLLGASLMKDKKTWHEIHADDEIAVSARGWGDDCPEGMVIVSVCRGGRGERGENLKNSRDILVPVEDYQDPDLKFPIGRHAGSFIADPLKNYRDVTPPPKPPNPPARRFREINMAGLTPAQMERAQRDLSRRYRFSGGTVRSVREIVESGGIVGKSAIKNHETGRSTYYLRHAVEEEGQPAGDVFYALEVSKALWDAIDAPASQRRG